MVAMVGVRASVDNDDDDDRTTTTISTKTTTKLDHDNQQQQESQEQEMMENNNDHHDYNGDDNVDDYDDDDDDDDECPKDAEPIGGVIRVSDHSGHKRNHFNSFQFDGHVFLLEDPVLVAPEEGKIKPSVALIKDIFQTEGENLMVSGQRFFRPEEAEKKEGGTWQSLDPRELFYSCHVDELDALNVMHKCVIHLVPLGKPVPDRKQDPGFIVRKYYDILRQKLRYLTDKDCENVLPPQGEA